MAIAAPFPAARASSRPVPRSVALPGTRPVGGDRPARTARATTGGSPARRAGLVLTRRGRMVLGLLCMLVLVVVVVASGRVPADAGTSIADQGRATGVVVVQPGESLWQIAQVVAPEVDPRATVTLIRELNALGAEAVRPGQSIVVPVTTSTTA